MLFKFIPPFLETIETGSLIFSGILMKYPVSEIHGTRIASFFSFFVFFVCFYFVFFVLF